MKFIIMFAIYYNFIVMNRYKQKEIELLRLVQQKRNNQFKVALNRLIESEQSLRIWLDYAEQIFNHQFQSYETFQEYSPNQLSKILLEKELQLIKKQFQKMPEKECKIEHFIIVVLKVMKFPLEKIPYYMIGLKDMFYEIVEESKDAITYENLFKYILGQLIIMKQQKQNTEFHVHFTENKKQDYLLHDNGIRKLLFSSDLKVFMSLDQRSNNIKFYNDEMKQINKYNAKKEQHNSKIPFIVDFDYSELTMRLGIIFNDDTIESIHLPHYLQKTEAEFQALSLNHLLYTMPEKMNKIVYLEMINKWMTVGQETDKIYLFDMEKVRLKPEEVEQHLNIDTNELKISFIKEIISLSLVCIVAGHQIHFFNENLKEKKFPKFSHHEDIKIFKYSEEYSTFYLLGQEKCITYFVVNRNRINFKLFTIPFNKMIIDFEIFPIFDSILIVDKDSDVRLFHLGQKITYQIQSSVNIVKTKDAKIKIQKFSKLSFLLYESYMISYNLQKMAIIKEAEYEFLPYYYFDAKKQQFFLSVNGQILSFSTTFGEIRKNFSEQISNICKHQWFFVSNKTNLFVLDNTKSIYELYLKSEQGDRQYKNYKKKMIIEDINSCIYDEQMRNLMMVTSSSISQVRNDYNNNFDPINNIDFVGIDKITNCIFCPTTKYLTFITQNQIIYQFKNFQRYFHNGFKFIFSKAAHDAFQKVIIQHEYCSLYEILILLNNRNQIAIVERLNTANYVLLTLEEYLPYNLRHIVFNKFKYQVFKRNNKNYTSIILYDENGFIFDLNLKNIIFNKFLNTQRQNIKVYNFIEQSYEIKSEGLTIQQRIFYTSQRLVLKPEEYTFKKLHDKQIFIATKLNVQIIVTLTISKEGIVKLWNSKFDCLFSLKLPSLIKIKWNMNQILNIKTERSINQIKKIFTQNYSLKKHIIQVNQAISKNKKYKIYDQPKKLKFNEEITVEIESKQLEQILLREDNYSKEYYTFKRISKSKNISNPEDKFITTIDTHPWRHRRQFTKLYEKASPPHKYSTIIPKDLILLRASLDMKAKMKKKIPTYNQAQTILPLLKTYEYEQKVQPQQQQKVINDKEKSQNFEACLYVKSQRKKKKLNELDQIDRQFLRKQIILKNKRIVSQKKTQKKKSNLDGDDYIYNSIQLDSFQTIKDIEKVFQEHNRECYENGKGHYIKIPKINVPRDE